MKNYLMPIGKRNNRGQLNLLVGLLLGFMVVTILVTLLPGFVSMLSMAQNSENLNCKGYVDSDGTDGNQTYNASMGTSTMACLAMKLYLPYLVLSVLIGLVMKILYDKQSSAPQPYYG